MLEVVTETGYFNLAYSDLAAMRMGMLGSASFQRVKKAWYWARALAVSPEIAEARASCAWASAMIGPFSTTPG
jgi:hypothetical protein